MVALPFTFSAEAGGFVYPTDPKEFAHRLWQFVDAENDLFAACELAHSDREYYDELRSWATNCTDLEGFPPTALATLCRTLAAPRPPLCKGPKQRRNARLQAVWKALCREFPDHPRKAPGGLADIVASLPGVHGSADSLYNNVLTKPQ
jgi:hypothetical protein